MVAASVYAIPEEVMLTPPQLQGTEGASPLSSEVVVVSPTEVCSSFSFSISSSLSPGTLGFPPPSDCQRMLLTEGIGWGKAGAAKCNGYFEVLARVPGPQTTYRAELFGALLAAMHASPFSTIILDNKAVVDGGWADLSREVSDLDLRSKLRTLLVEKSLTLHWVPSHRTCNPPSPLRRGMSFSKITEWTFWQSGPQRSHNSASPPKILQIFLSVEAKPPFQPGNGFC